MLIISLSRPQFQKRSNRDPQSIIHCCEIHFPPSYLTSFLGWLEPEDCTKVSIICINSFVNGSDRLVMNGNISLIKWWSAWRQFKLGHCILRAWSISCFDTLRCFPPFFVFKQPYDDFTRRAKLNITGLMSS